MLAIAAVPVLDLLGGSSQAAALVLPDTEITYGELADRVEARRGALGTARRLVMLHATNNVESVVTYLAALAGGHPVLLVGPDTEEASARHAASLIARFDPDVIAGSSRSETHLHERREGSAHSFGPDLALLVSTSGSTGSSKLVRLSRENIESNGRAIAQYLRLAPDDRAATTLPMHYCYGLSVINSHLLAGASIVLTERSVTDNAFWQEATVHKITSFAGVPHTFDLLEAGQFTDRLPESLRYITQAGGRLEPDAVRRFARLGERRGFEFFVMYGQTEATARMAYVPAELADSAAGTIGHPIPGGRLRVDAEPGSDTGELIFEGPNVMLGYAESPADFRLGRTVTELRTGDLAKRRTDGLFEIVGRMNRFVKVYGLRIDLDAVQRLLDEEGVEARTASVDERLLVFVRAERQLAVARARAAALVGIPQHAIRVYPVAEFPRTSTGKPDFAALVRYARQFEGTNDAADGGSPHPAQQRNLLPADAIRDLFAELLGRPDATAQDSFAGLGGDSLSYVEMSLRLEERLGRLPRDWPSWSAEALAASVEPIGDPAVSAVTASNPDSVPHRIRATRLLARVETSAVLRALAIVLIVATHADLLTLQGGAHLLLAVAGFNLARFQLADVAGETRVRRLLSSAAQIAVPSILWIGVIALISGKYALSTTLLMNNVVPNDGRWSEQWQFWFLEVAIWTIVGFALVFAIRPIDRVERRHPWGFALALLIAALLLRFALVGVHAHGIERYAAPIVLWCMMLGWAVARADSARKRIMLSVVTVGATAGFFGDPIREGIIGGGILLLIWIPSLRIPRLFVPAVQLLAGASLFIYLTHWVVYPAWEASAPWFGTLLSLAVGMAVWAVHLLAVRWLRSLRRPHQPSKHPRRRTAIRPARPDRARLHRQR
ncbi:MAG TPA: AMP-binding protein [Homoserinimonas sp.]|nr:AMP-binding protein [Homoserinimonas sp.]